MEDFSGYKPVVLPGSEDYWSAYEYGRELEKAFPGQDAGDFMYGNQYNTPRELERALAVGITNFICLHHGANDEDAWVWSVHLGDGSEWIVTGGCDYTGWDCQSWMDWEDAK